MVKFNPKLKQEMEKFLDYVIIVEGKKDEIALMKLGFTKVYAIHKTGVQLKENLLHISNQIGKKDRVCILTDFDRKGKQLYLIAKSELQQLGARLDSTLRGILIKSGISHIEGISTFFEKVQRIG